MCTHIEYNITFSLSSLIEGENKNDFIKDYNMMNGYRGET